MPESKTELAKREVLRMSNEASNRLTRECLQTALIYLMGQKPFDKISITELVKRAGVSRTAFYRNYTSKEDILIELKESIFHAISDSISSLESKNDYYKWFCHCFQAIKDNASLFRLLLLANLSREPLSDFNSVLERCIPSHTIAEHYQKLAIEGAFSAIIMNWFNNGMNEEVSFMADLCMNLVKDKI